MGKKIEISGKKKWRNEYTSSRGMGQEELKNNSEYTSIGVGLEEWKNENEYTSIGV